MQVLDPAGLDGLYEAYNLILIGFGYLATKHFGDGRFSPTACI